MKPADAAEQLRIAHERLVACYETAIAKQDAGAAVAAQRELNKLLGLYAAPDIEEEADAADLRDLLAAVRSHLEPLWPPGRFATTDGAVILTSELARLAAAEILQLRATAR